MRILMKRTYYDGLVTYGAGEVHEVEDRLADRLVELREAVPADEPKTKPKGKGGSKR